MELLIILFLVLLNGLFSMSEIAIVTAKKTRLELAARKGNRNAKVALETALNPNKFFSTVQIGITLIGIVTGVFSGENVTNDIKRYVDGITLLQPYSHGIAVGLVVLFITFLSLVLGELVPKRIGIANPEAIAKAVAKPMGILTTIVSPFVWLLTATSDFIISVFGFKASEEEKVTEEEIKAIIQEGTEHGEVQEIEQNIVERVFTLGDRDIASLMTHRSEVVFIELGTSTESIKKTVNAELHSVYPVYDGDKDNVVGVVVLKDLFAHIHDADFDLSKYIQLPQYLAETTSAYKTLQEFKQSKVHYGIITDEYGHVNGIVTMYDILTALVGYSSDFNDGETGLLLREDGTWLVDGQYSFGDFLHQFDIPLSEDHHFYTISGLILHVLKEIPKEGDKITWNHFELEVLDMDGRKIDKVLVKRVSQ